MIPKDYKEIMDIIRILVNRAMKKGELIDLGAVIDKMSFNECLKVLIYAKRKQHFNYYLQSLHRASQLNDNKKYKQEPVNSRIKELIKWAK
jgi:hypothetical protein